MLPPWKKYPKIWRFSIGWRMGKGESYLYQWESWFLKLPKEEQRNYISQNIGSSGGLYEEFAILTKIETTNELKNRSPRI
ncbi:hypothetical protein [Aureispira anguillae]|uniref:Uncharacterized protein n=1 Tax=Aureispira anguillae TaxID=2864201 RepID=A0A915YE32_9BACT|nr:hypothetical protein [Aureispira anguillae]BDS11328.1 hypothetical protein AsAng_0020400 [Aureispira anguillae]